MKCIKQLDHKSGTYGKIIRVSDREAFDKVERCWKRDSSWDYCPKHEWKAQNSREAK
jgi:hypothetical protein